MVDIHNMCVNHCSRHIMPTCVSYILVLEVCAIFSPRSHSTVEDSPEEEPKSKRPRPASPVRAIRSRRTKDVPLEQSQLIEVKAEKSRNGADGTDDKADAKMLSSQMSLSSREDPSAPVRICCVVAYIFLYLDCAVYLFVWESCNTCTLVSAKHFYCVVRVANSLPLCPECYIIHFRHSSWLCCLLSFLQR